MSTNESVSPVPEEASKASSEAPPVAPDVPEDRGEDPPGLREKLAAASRELERPAPPDDTNSEEGDAGAAKAARAERMRLMPEYLEHFFLEDLPPIDTNDPWNQGIYMRYRINQMRSAQGKEPVQ